MFDCQGGHCTAFWRDGHQAIRTFLGGVGELQRTKILGQKFDPSPFPDPTSWRFFLWLGMVFTCFQKQVLRRFAKCSLTQIWKKTLDKLTGFLWFSAGFSPSSLGWSWWHPTVANDAPGAGGFPSLFGSSGWAGRAPLRQPQGRRRVEELPKWVKLENSRCTS